MVDREREQLGPFVITKQSNVSQEGIVCSHCGKLLSKFDRESDTHDPSPEQLHASGAVAVPNLGWFCGQACGNAFSAEFGMVFQRREDGKISYYD